MSSRQGMDTDEIEQYTATQPISHIKQFSEVSSSAGPKALAGFVTTGAEPHSVEGRTAKQRHRQYDDDMAQTAVEVLAFRKASEKMGMARLRQLNSGATDDELFEIWKRHLFGQIVDAEGNPIRGDKADLVDKEHEEGNKRVIEYCECLANNPNSSIHLKSLDCTFCGAWFPPLFLLSINPVEIEDWRNTHYRCCYKCAACHSEDFIWYSECSSLRPAILHKPGAVGGERYDNFDRQGVEDFDHDWERKPSQWHIAVDTTTGAYARLYFDSVWDYRMDRWVRKPVFHIKDKVTSDISVFEWYRLCSKVLTWRKQHAEGKVRDRNNSWKAMSERVQREHPNASSSEVRREVRQRILHLTDRS